MHTKEIEVIPNKVPSFIWYFLKDYKTIITIFIFITITSGLWGPLNSVLIKYLINTLTYVEYETMYPILWPSVLIVINFVVLNNISFRLVECINYLYQGSLKNRMIRKVARYVLHQQHSFFQNNLSGRIARQITGLADGIEFIIHTVSEHFIRGMSLLIASLITAFFVNPVFCYILTVWFLLFYSFSVWMSKKLVILSGNHAIQEAWFSGQLVDVMSNNRNVRLFSRKNYEMNRMNQFLEPVLDAFKKKKQFSILLSSMQGLLIAVMVGFIIFFLVKLYKIGLVTIGDFALMLNLAMHLGNVFWCTTSRVDEFNDTYGRCKQALLALMPEIQIKDAPNATKLKCSEGRICFKKVKFAYDNKKILFNEQSLEIEPKQKIGLVGYSGAGKSTFVNLILRIYDVISGSVTVDGQDVRKVTQESLHRCITTIPQDPFLFNRNLLENIRYGRLNATDEEVIEAARRAHAHEFIMDFPQEYNTIVGERGIKLSGGQRQRIAIARAMIKNSPIFILDEPTSQLDIITESMIQSVLYEFMRDKTTIVIAHRLSTLLNMDRILVFSKGNIVADGTHETLLQENNLYKKLWHTQVGGFLGVVENE